jgi:hypothetical protein
MGPRRNKKAPKRKGEVENEEEASIPAPPGTETTLTEVGQEVMNPTVGSEEEARLRGAREEARRIVNRLIQDELTEQTARQQLRRSEVGIQLRNVTRERDALADFMTRAVQERLYRKSWLPRPSECLRTVNSSRCSRGRWNLKPP